MRRIAIAAVLLLAAAALAGTGRPERAQATQATTPETDTVTVSGSASVSAVPGRATFSFGVDSRADTARAALAANGKEMRKVIDAVKAGGGRDVGTQSVSLSQVLGQDSQIIAFAAANSVSATIELGRAGALIDAAVDAGANQVYGPSLAVADQATLYKRALEGAVADARQRAEVLATAAGRTLGRVTALVEGGGSVAFTSSKTAAADASTPIEAGTQDTTATVSVTFALV